MPLIALSILGRDKGTHNMASNTHGPKGASNMSDSQSEISELVEMAKEIGQADSYAGKRNNTRYKVGERLDICTDPNNASSANVAILHNISDEGAAIWLKVAAEAGKIIYIRQFLANGEATWTKSVVRHCTRGIKGFLVGVTFKH